MAEQWFVKPLVVGSIPAESFGCDLWSAMQYLPPYDKFTPEDMNSLKDGIRGKDIGFLIEKVTTTIGGYPEFLGENRRGFVYLIQSQTGPCKIGITSQSPSERLNGLQTAHWDDLKISYVYPCTYPNLYGGALHEYFKAFRLRGEWFSLTADIIVNESETPRFLKWHKYIPSYHENFWKRAG